MRKKLAALPICIVSIMAFTLMLPHTCARTYQSRTVETWTIEEDGWTAKFRVKWIETWDDDGNWMAFFHFQEWSKIRGEDGKISPWHNEVRIFETERKETYTYKLNDMWEIGHPPWWPERIIHIYHDVNGEIRVDHYMERS